MRKWIGLIVLSPLLFYLTLAQSQSDGLDVAFSSSLPKCASSCGELYDVQQACIPPLTTSSSSQSCFCNDLRLIQFLQGATGVAAVCNASISINANKHTLTISTNKAGQIIIGTQTVPPNGLITIDGGEVLTLAPQITGVASTPIYGLPTIQLGGSIYTQNSAGNFIIGNQTLSKGGRITTDGETISLSPNNDVIFNGMLPNPTIPMSAPPAMSAPQASSAPHASSVSPASPAPPVMSAPPASSVPAAPIPITSLVIAGQTITRGGQITIGGNVFEFPVVTGRTVLGRRIASPTPTAASPVVSCTAVTDFQAIGDWYRSYCEPKTVARDTGLSKGAQAGIGIGASILGLLIIGSILWFFFRRRKPTPEEVVTPPSKTSWEKAEMDAGTPRHERTTELAGDDKKMELKGDGGDLELAGDYIRAELQGDNVWAELEGENSVGHSGDSQETLVNRRQA